MIPETEQSDQRQARRTKIVLCVIVVAPIISTILFLLYLDFTGLIKIW
jgi:hypothetical protein